MLIERNKSNDENFSNRSSNNSAELTNSTFPQRDKPRVAVIGAGIAGLTTALDLQKNGFDVVVFEAADRVGGRILSEIPKFGVPIELGGQLINGLEHAPLLDFMAELGIEKRDRFAADQPYQRSAFVVDGIEYSDEQLAEGLSDLLSDIRTEKSFEAYPTLSSLLKAYTKIPPWCAVVLESVSTAELGIDPHNMKTTEFLEYYLKGLASGQGIVARDYGQFCCKDGNQQIPMKIADSLGDRVQTNHLLKAASGGVGDQIYRLHLVDGDGAGRIVEAELLVFALPYSALRKVDLSQLPLSDERREAISSLEYNNHGKIVSEIYGVDENDLGGANVALVCTTTDGKAEAAHWTWPTDRASGGSAMHLVSFEELPIEEGGKFLRLATSSELRSLEKQCEDLFPSATLFGNSFVVNWGHKETAGGAYAAASAEFLDRYPNGLSQEESGTGIYFCGEHITSANNPTPGFMNTAFLSGRIVAEAIVDRYSTNSIVGEETLSPV
jgi:monoamine oxidase